MFKYGIQCCLYQSDVKNESSKQHVKILRNHTRPAENRGYQSVLIVICYFNGNINMIYQISQDVDMTLREFSILCLINVLSSLEFVNLLSNKGGC